MVTCAKRGRAGSAVGCAARCFRSSADQRSSLDREAASAAGAIPDGLGAESPSGVPRIPIADPATVSAATTIEIRNAFALPVSPKVPSTLPGRAYKP